MNKSRFAHSLWLGATIYTIAAFSLLGCGGGQSGPQRASISGTVTIDGALVENGTIEFAPSGTTKGPLASGSIEQGKYSISTLGPVVGTHKVSISWIKNTHQKDPSGAEIFVQAIPEKYNKATTLEVTVKSGNVTANFELKTN